MLAVSRLGPAFGWQRPSWCFGRDVFPRDGEEEVDKRGFTGVFDSGVGGISVLKSLVRELPCEDFVFFGDSANAPYGEKDTEQVISSISDIGKKVSD